MRPVDKKHLIKMRDLTSIPLFLQNKAIGLIMETHSNFNFHIIWLEMQKKIYQGV